MVGEEISVVLSRQVCSHLSQSPYKTNMVAHVFTCFLFFLRRIEGHGQGFLEQEVWLDTRTHHKGTSIVPKAQPTAAQPGLPNPLAQCISKTYGCLWLL